MGQLIKTKKKSITDPMAYSIPEFRDVYKEYGEMALFWIILVYDYWSPLRNLSQNERMQEATKSISKKLKITKEMIEDSVFINAIEKYKALQYDPILEQYQIYSQKIKEINLIVESKKATFDSIRDIQDIIKNMEKISEMVISLKKHIDSSSRTTGIENIMSITDFHKLNIQ